jgi:hypothetical protein
LLPRTSRRSVFQAGHHAPEVEGQWRRARHGVAPRIALLMKTRFEWHHRGPPRVQSAMDLRVRD